MKTTHELKNNKKTQTVGGQIILSPILPHLGWILHTNLETQTRLKNSGNYSERELLNHATTEHKKILAVQHANLLFSQGYLLQHIEHFSSG